MSQEQRDDKVRDGWTMYRKCFRDLFGRDLHRDDVNDLAVSPAVLEEMFRRLSSAHFRES